MISVRILGFIARGLTTPTPLSRPTSAPSRRAAFLALLKSSVIHSNWFTPGYTIKSYPRECEAVPIRPDRGEPHRLQTRRGDPVELGKP